MTARQPPQRPPARVRQSEPVLPGRVELSRAAATALAPGLGRVSVLVGERLSGSDRSVVVRAVARTEDDREHRVVLKQPATNGPGGVREEAALQLARRYALPGVVPLLGTCPDPPLLALADLGAGPTLADRLLADDPVAAEAAVLSWARAVGALQATTTGLRQSFLDEMAGLSPLGAPLLDTTGEQLVVAAALLARELPRLGVQVPDAALQELRAGAVELDVAGPGRPGGLVPGDTCPSNLVETAGGVVLLDFEGAEYRHVAWEAAYLTVPWPSCWCSWRLPEDVAAAAVEAWRQSVLPALPAVADPRFSRDLDRATVCWVFISASWLLPQALDGDPPPTDPARRSIVPSRRALLQHRLRVAAEHPGPDLPALRELAARSYAAAVRQWGRQPLALAAAFR